MLTSQHHRPRILFFGMRCDFSIQPLSAVLNAGFDVCAVVVPAAGSPPGSEPLRLLGSGGAGLALPLLSASRMRTIVDVARESNVPVLEVSDLNDRRAVDAFAETRPDLICVACFPKRLPPTLLALPPLGSLNVHPSLLPANRGPVPLFWTFRNGERRTGVTVHLMENTLDTGDTLLQEPVDVPDGMTGRELDLRCAQVGGELLVEAVSALVAGTASRTKQAPEQGSYHSWPTPADFIVDPTWTARHAFNFIRGASPWGTPQINVYGNPMPVVDAIAYDPERRLGAPIVAAGEHIWLQCNPGIVQIRVMSDE